MSLYLGNNLISGSGTSMEPLRNMGQIISSTLPLMDAGLHLLDGALISGSGSYGAFVDYIADIYDGGNYPDLFDTEANWQSAVTQYGVCGKFVYTPQKYAFIYPGDNSTGWYCNSLEVGANFYTASGSRLSTIASISGNHITIADSSLFPLGFDRDTANDVELSVRLPKITGVIEGTTNVSALGDLVEAGLPNITGGGWNVGGANNSDWSGAFSSNVLERYNLSTGTQNGVGNLYFNASRSSSIYGNSNTVQPQAIKVLYYIVVATSTKTDIQVDIDEIATDLNGKADVDGSNMVNSVKNFDGGWVFSYLNLVTRGTVPSSTDRAYDLSSYLPNDGYNYEVWVNAVGETAATSGHGQTIALFSNFTDGVVYYLYRIVTRTASSMRGAGTARVPIGSDRKLYLQHYANTNSNSGTFEMSVRGYRRIGTNQ